MSSSDGITVRATSHGRRHHLTRTLVASGFLVAAVIGVAGTPVRAQSADAPVRDIDARGASSVPRGFVDVDGVPFFVACDSSDDLFLWRATDDGSGVEQLARVARDRRSSCPEDGSSVLLESAVLDGRLYFVVDRGDLWVSDGTPEGTGTAALAPDESRFASPTSVGDRLFFVTLDGVGDPEALWASDGTQDGTNRVRSVPARDLVAFGDRLLFWGDDASHGWEPWISDGTKAGTHLVRDLVTGSGGSRLRSAAQLGSRVYAAIALGSAGTELWRTDGTTSGTTRVRDFRPGAADSVAEVIRAGDRLYFRARDGHGSELWTSDGTTAGTRLVRDLRSGSGSSTPRGLVAFGDQVVFEADGNGGAGVWVSDGTTSSTTEVLADVWLAAARPVAAVLRDRLLFGASTETSKGDVLWTTDGTAGGTHRVVGGSVVHDVAGLVASGDRVVFAGSSARGLEPWVTDGSRAGTSMLADLNTDTLGSLPSWDSSLEDAGAATGFVALGSRRYFVADDGVHGSEPWRTDGTSDRTRLVKDIRAGSAGSSPSLPVVAGDRLYFSADDGTHGRELWVSDGTAGGTRLVRDIRSGASDSSPHQLTAVGDRLLFATADQSLWVTDGTAAGTLRLKRAADAQGGSTGVTEMVGTGALAYLVWDTNRADCDQHAEVCTVERLWVTDGTPDGTRQVSSTDLRPAGSLIPLGSGVAFASGTQLWTSDGTGDGTHAVRSFQRLGALASLGDRLVFHGCRASTGCEPWVSDGTSAGTHLLADVVPGTEGSEPRQFVVVGDRVFFGAFAQGADRLSLWVADGTADGTRQVLDLAPSRAAAVGDRLVFAADDGDAGREPWVSDGTPDGTRMLADLHPYRDSDPYGFAPLGSGVLMAADDGDHGTEPWYLALP